MRDQRWLDDRIAAIDDGVQAVIDIAHNWTDGRHLERLHPGVSAAEYVTSRVGTLGRSVVPILLTESNWSNRQIAAVAGVHNTTVMRERTAANAAVEHLDNPATWQRGHDYRPTETLGADGKLRPARVVRQVRTDMIEEEVGDGGEPIEVVSQVTWDELAALMDAISRVVDHDATATAATVPSRRRAATARRLRALGTELGRIALSIERLGG